MKANSIYNKYFTRRNVSCKEGPGGIPIVEVDNQFGHLRLCLLGANVIDWTPRDAEPVIWLSEKARFEAGKSIRGGVPICWPWFGAHASEADFPAHGYARTQKWEVIDIRTLAHGETRISFTLPPHKSLEKYWPFVTEVEYHVTVGKTLELELVSCNLGSTAVSITQALHTYFRVGDVSKVTLHGLENKHYLDKVENFKQKEQIGPITINQEVDRIYLNTSDECIIEDPTLKRKISIKKTGSNSTVVWNPWQATAEKMGDLGDNGYLNMLCVESSNAANDIITLEQGDQHRLIVKYEVTQL